MAGWLDTILKVWDAYLTKDSTPFINEAGDKCMYQGRDAKYTNTTVLKKTGTSGSTGKDVYDCVDLKYIACLGFSKAKTVRADCAGFVSSCLLEAGWATGLVTCGNFNSTNPGSNFSGSGNFKKLVFSKSLRLTKGASIALKDGGNYKPQAGDILVKTGGGHVNIYYDGTTFFDMGNSVSLSLKGKRGRTVGRMEFSSAWQWTKAECNSNIGDCTALTVDGNTLTDDTTSDSATSTTSSTSSTNSELATATPRTYAGIGENAYIADDTPESVLEALDIYEAEQWNGVTDVLNGPVSTITSVNSYWSHALLAYYECPDIVDNNENLSKGTKIEDESDTNVSIFANAIVNSEDNASNVKVEGQTEDKKKFRRIVREENKSESVIVLKEMSKPADDSDGQGTAISESNRLGVIAPIIKFNGVLYESSEITSMVISSVDKVPTIRLQLHVPAENINEAIVMQGTLLSVFYHAGHDDITSYRGDYHINSVSINKLGDGSVIYDISGILNIPKLFDQSLPTYSGDAMTSKKALRKIAMELGLHWQFSDPEDTNDTQVWYCTPTTKDGDNTPLYVKYINDIVKHAYKNKDSYFDWWIDPRNALTFSNMNYILGEDGEDEEVLLAFLTSNLTSDISMSKFLLKSHELATKIGVMPHMLHNVAEEGEAANTPFFIRKAEMVDKQRFAFAGTSADIHFEINNIALQLDETNTDDNDKSQINFSAKICSNPYKLEHGWRLDLGGAEHGNTADNGNYGLLHVHSFVSSIIETFSNNDATNIKKSGSTDQASGTTHRFHTVALVHNNINLNYLYHKVVKLTMVGNNMQLVKGDKIPVMYIDLAQRTNPVNSNIPTVLALLDQLKCGWFIIKSILKMYQTSWNDDLGKAAGWRTVVELVRRDWPVPNYMELQTSEKSDNKSDNGKTKVITVKNDFANTTDETWEDPNGVTASYDNKESANDVTASGLTKATEKLFNELSSWSKMYGSSVKMVAGRRWAADAKGNKTTGDGYILNEAGAYKFVNSDGVVMWFNDPDSRHVYGEAIDIINDKGTDFKRVMSLILTDNELIGQMLTQGYFCMVEQSKDATGNISKHYHIGTARKDNNADLEALKKWWTNVLLYKGATLDYNGKTYEYAYYLQYANSFVAPTYSNLEAFSQDATPIVVNVNDIETDLKTIQEAIIYKKLDSYVEAIEGEETNTVIIAYIGNYNGSTKLPSNYKSDPSDITPFSPGYMLATCVYEITKSWESNVVNEDMLNYSDEAEYAEDSWKKLNNYDATMTALIEKMSTMIPDDEDYIVIYYVTAKMPEFKLRSEFDNDSTHLAELNELKKQYTSLDEYTLALALYEEWKKDYYVDPNNDMIFNNDYHNSAAEDKA